MTRRNLSTRPVRTIHEDIRDARTASMVRSLENLVRITEREVSDSTEADRGRLQAELNGWRAQLAAMTAPALNVAA